MGFISSIFGYILNFIYELVKNYGVAIILFSVLIKLLLLPMSIKQQKTMKKTAKVQAKMREIQEKYKGNQEKINQETLELYKRENLNPLSGCFSMIIQLILLFSVFYLVKSPLTYMKNIDQTVIEEYKTKISAEEVVNSAYPEISIIDYVARNNGEADELYINMDFLGLNLSKIPKENWKDLTVFIIPLAYVITTFISMKVTESMNKRKQNKDKKEIIINNEDAENKENKKEENVDMNAEMSRSMTWFMPVMAVSISLIAPLGLALYWVINNITMIIERVILDRVIKDEEEE